MTHRVRCTRRLVSGWRKSFFTLGAFCFSSLTLTAFIRISTNLRVFHYPLSLVEAVRVVGDWLQQPNAVILNPGEHHWQIFSKYLRDSRATGPLATDAQPRRSGSGAWRDSRYRS